MNIFEKINQTSLIDPLITILFFNGKFIGSDEHREFFDSLNTEKVTNYFDSLEEYSKEYLSLLIDYFNERKYVEYFDDLFIMAKDIFDVEEKTTKSFIQNMAEKRMGQRNAVFGYLANQEFTNESLMDIMNYLCCTNPNVYIAFIDFFNEKYKLKLNTKDTRPKDIVEIIRKNNLLQLYFIIIALGLHNEWVTDTRGEELTNILEKNNE